MSDQRPLFCLSAFPGDGRISSNNMNSIRAYLSNAQNFYPARAQEFEHAAESVLRNNGFDPCHDRGWKDAGITGGYNEAVGIIKQAYLEAIPQLLQGLKNDVKNAPYDYTPTATLRHNPLKAAMDSLKRAHLDKPADFLTSDEAWQDAVGMSVKELQQSIREYFVDKRVGGYVAYNLDPDSDSNSVSQVDQLSIQAADCFIRDAFPELADVLEIPKDIRDGLVPNTSDIKLGFVASAQPT